MSVEDVTSGAVGAHTVAEPAGSTRGRLADRLADPPADMLDRARLLEEVETDLRSQLGALDGR